MKKDLSKIFIIILTLFFSFSCAKKGGQQAVLSFNLSAYFVSSGGAMIWGENPQTGETFADNVSMQANHTRFLSFGPWKFWVMAWATNDNSDAMSGMSKCDFQTKLIDPNSQNIAIQFNLTNLNCQNTTFAPATNSVFTTNAAANTFMMFPAIRFKNCRSLSGSLAYADPCVAGTEQGYYSSYRVIIPEHHNFNPTGNGQVSKCVRVDPLNGSYSEFYLPANIPLGSLSLNKPPLLTVVEGFFGSQDCGVTNLYTDPTTIGSVKHVYKRGIINGSQGVNVKTSIESGTAAYCAADFGISANSANCSSNNFICSGSDKDGDISANCTSDPLAINNTIDSSGYNSFTVYEIVTETTSEDVCSGGRENIVETFASGIGDDGRPYTICHPDQFNHIHDVTSYLASSFEVLKDLNFNQSTNVVCSTGLATNFNPVGGSVYNGGCATITTVPIAFSGKFNGNDHKFMQPRFRSGPSNRIGLFRIVDGATAVVERIQIDNGEIGAGQRVGMIAGLCNSGIIRQIAIDNLEVSSENISNSLVGGVVGEVSASTCSIDDIDIYDMSVEGESTYIGGIAGDSSGAISNIHISGDISARGYSQGGTDNVGGIAGRILNASISKSAFHGSVAGSRNVGGIAGLVSGASGMVIDSYAKGNIISTEFVSAGAARLGGIAGQTAAGSGGLTNTFFLGAISHQCIADDTTCRIGQLVGLANAVPIITSYQHQDFSFAPTANLGGLAGTARTEAQFRSSTTANFAGFNFTTDWSFVLGDHPRLQREIIVDDCEIASNNTTVSNQITLLRGITAANPIIICSLAQMKEIAANLNLVYRLGDDVPLWGWTEADSPIGFTGIFDGDDFALLGGRIAPAGINSGIFSTIAVSGEIHNLKVSGFENLSASRNQVGGLVGINNGTITETDVFAKAFGAVNIGIIAGQNNGDILNSSSSGQVKGEINVGGMVGHNDVLGTIFQSSSQADIMPDSSAACTAASTCSIVGGVAGNNDGYLDQVSSNSQINDNGTFLFLDKIGGIVGSNSSTGTIVNSSFTQEGEIRVAGGPTGGIAGENLALGVISSSVSFGRVIHDLGSPVVNVPANFNALVGTNSGTVSTDNYYRQEPFIQYEPITYTALSCSFTGPFLTIMSTATLINGANAYTDTYLSIDNQIDNALPTTGSTGGAAPYTMTINNGFNECANIEAATNMELIKFKTTSGLGQSLSFNQINDIDQYCPGASSGDIFFTCGSGFDIAENYEGIDGVGTERILDYYISTTNDTIPLLTPPIWVLENGVGRSPRLFSDMHFR